MNDQPVIHLKNSLSTDYSGIKCLFEFYHKAAQYYNTTVYINFYNLIWFDANLSALLGCILAKLHNDNNLLFSTDIKFLEDRFDVLFRNGFLINNQIVDDQKSTISFMEFSPLDKDGFVSYIENDLLGHRGFPKLEEEIKDSIIDSLIEIFCNIQNHSKSEENFYVCGQYYAKKKSLVFSIVDVGVGFLPAIMSKTNNEINNSLDAIIWALKKGNTTRINIPGGLGLNDLYKYFKETNGNLQIITGDTFWSIDLESTKISSYNFDKCFVGTTINLFFNCN